MLTPEEHDAWEQALTDCWAGTSQTSTAAASLHQILLDAEQAHEEWARMKLTEATERGLAAMAKAWRRKQARTKSGPVNLTGGVVEKSPTGAPVFVQLALVDCTPAQLRQKLNERETQLKAASRNAKFIRNLLAVCDRHPNAPTLGAALLAEGVSLDEVLAA